jgi:hypothetical protein
MGTTDQLKDSNFDKEQIVKCKIRRFRPAKRRSTGALFELLSLEPRQLLSATLHWQAWGNGILEDAGNWVENQAPAAGDDLVIGVDANIGLGADTPEYGSLTVGNSTANIVVSLNLHAHDLNTEVLFVAPGSKNGQLTLMDGNFYATGAPSWIGDGCEGKLQLDGVYANFSELNVGAFAGGIGSLTLDSDSQAVIDSDLSIGSWGPVDRSQLRAEDWRLIG